MGNMQSVDLNNVDLPAVCTSSCSKQKTDEKKEACEKRCYIMKETCGTECNVNGRGKGKLKYCGKCIQDCNGDDTCMNGCVTDKKCTECSKCFEDNMQSVDLNNVDLPAVCTSSCSKQK